MKQKILLILIFLTPLSSFAHDYPTNDPQDKILKEIGVDEKLNAPIPLELEFTDNTGKAVKLKDYFTGEPVVLTLNFYECPMLCPMTFKYLIETIYGMQGLSLDKDFKVVTISFNELDTTQIAAEKAAENHKSLKDIKNPGERWPFLTGNADSINKLTTAVGYKYKRLEGGDFAHSATFIVITPDGKVSRYLHGIKVEPRDLKLALIEAADGKIGKSTAMNKVLMFCFNYDPEGKKYVLYAWNIMKASGAVTIVLLGVFFYFILKRKKT